jgi:hypothetical protein
MISDDRDIMMRFSSCPVIPTTPIPTDAIYVAHGCWGSDSMVFGWGATPDDAERSARAEICRALKAGDIDDMPMRLEIAPVSR